MEKIKCVTCGESTDEPIGIEPECINCFENIFAKEEE